MKKFLAKNEAKIAMFFGFILVSVISFQAGILQGEKWLQEPLVVEKPAVALEDMGRADLSENKAPEEVSTQAVVTGSDSEAEEKSLSDCKYVGSKNSDKFYLSTCPWAKRIKPQNVVCFSSPDEALGLGRTESKCD